MNYKDFIVLGILIIWLIVSLIAMRNNKCSGSCANCKKRNCNKNNPEKNQTL